MQEFVSTQNLQEVRSIQEGILNLYRRDISQYAPDDDRPAIQEIFDRVPTRLDSQGKRFTFASIAPRGTYERYKNQVLWLVEAHVVLPVPSVTEPNHPLKLQESRSYFKLFMNDVGLLTCSYGLEALKRMLCADLDISCGSLFENAVAQELVAHGHDLHYYRSKGVGEVDFVLEQGGGTVQLVQVKSGKSYKRHSALTKLLAREDHAIDSAVVLCENNLSVVDKVVYCPVYMAMYL